MAATQMSLGTAATSDRGAVSGHGRKQGLVQRSVAAIAARPALWAWAAIGAAMLGGATLLALFRLPDRPAASLCLLYNATGIPCPGCGMTRAVSYLLHGEWRAAMRLHPLAPLVVAEAAGVWLFFGLRLTGSGRWPVLWAAFLRRVPLLLAIESAVLLGLWVERWVAGTLPW